MDSAAAFRLSDKVQQTIREKTGLTVEAIADMDPDQIASHLNRRAKKTFRFDTFHDVAQQLGRGQVHPFADRLITKEEVDRGLR